MLFELPNSEKISFYITQSMDLQMDIVKKPCATIDEQRSANRIGYLLTRTNETCIPRC
jgi:hypothetical protein